MRRARTNVECIANYAIIGPYDDIDVFIACDVQTALRVVDNARPAGGLSPFVAVGWEHYPHGADIGVRGYGTSKAQAFEQAACALTAVVSDPATVEPREAVAICCDAPDDELLLVEWLNCLVYEMATRKMLFSRFVVRIDGGQLSAEALGERVDPARHDPAVEVKGATYTTLRLGCEDGRWVAQTVVDV